MHFSHGPNLSETMKPKSLSSEVAKNIAFNLIYQSVTKNFNVITFPQYSSCNF